MKTAAPGAGLGQSVSNPIADELTRKGVILNIGGSIYDPHGPVGKLLFNVLGMVAEFESDLIRARTREGMAVAKGKGKLRGRQPKLSKRQEAHLVSLHQGGVHTVTEIAELFGVARSTVCRAIQRAAPTRWSLPGSERTASELSCRGLSTTVTPRAGDFGYSDFHTRLHKSRTFGAA